MKTAAAACNIAGLVYIDAPLRLNANTLNGAMINGFMTRMGGGGLLATEVGNGANLVGPSGITVVNPVANTPGIVGGPIGFGAPGWGPFLTVGDIRDPNFQGNLTVQGNIETRSRVDVTNAADTCNLASIWTNAAGVGEFAARSAACVRRAFVSGDGTVGVASATGQTRAILDGNTGEIRALGADGTTLRAGFIYNAGGESEAMADNLRNSQAPGSPNAAGITLDGRVYGRRGDFGSVVINNTAVQGAVCTVANELVWGTNNGAPVLMKCEGGQYVYADGTTVATAGSPCAQPGAVAQTNVGVQLLCENGQWISTISRLGRLQLQASVRVQNGNSVSKPACASPATSHLMLVPLNIDATSGAVSYYATDVGWNWTIQILDNDGLVSTNSSALAHTYCAF